jgi:glucose-6-phosphate-specific signal transduction histidine kinase
MLDEVGLMPALEWYVSGFSERSGIAVSREIIDTNQPLSRELNTALFRIIQEALANIHKHAESKEARIRLYHNENLVILEITDSGKGISSAHCRTVSEYADLGWHRGHVRRVRQLGGMLELVQIRGLWWSITANQNHGENDGNLECWWLTITKSYGKVCAASSKNSRDGKSLAKPAAAVKPLIRLRPFGRTCR